MQAWHSPPRGQRISIYMHYILQWLWLMSILAGKDGDWGVNEWAPCYSWWFPCAFCYVLLPAKPQTTKPGIPLFGSIGPICHSSLQLLRNCRTYNTTVVFRLSTMNGGLAGWMVVASAWDLIFMLGAMLSGKDWIINIVYPHKCHGSGPIKNTVGGMRHWIVIFEMPNHGVSTTHPSYCMNASGWDRVANQAIARTISQFPNFVPLPPNLPFRHFLL